MVGAGPLVVLFVLVLAFTVVVAGGSRLSRSEGFEDSKLLLPMLVGHLEQGGGMAVVGQGLHFLRSLSEYGLRAPAVF